MSRSSQFAFNAPSSPPPMSLPQSAHPNNPGENSRSLGKKDAYVRDEHFFPQGVHRDEGARDRLREPAGGVHGHGEGLEQGAHNEGGNGGLWRGVLSRPSTAVYRRIRRWLQTVGVVDECRPSGSSTVVNRLRRRFLRTVGVVDGCGTSMVVDR